MMSTTAGTPVRAATLSRSQAPPRRVRITHPTASHARRAVARQVVMFFFSSRRRHTRFDCDWSSDVCSSDLPSFLAMGLRKRFDHVKRVRKIGWDADAARTPDHGLFPKAGLTCNLACLEEIVKIGRASCRERV